MKRCNKVDDGICLGVDEDGDPLPGCCCYVALVMHAQRLSDKEFTKMVYGVISKNRRWSWLP